MTPSVWLPARSPAAGQGRPPLSSGSAKPVPAPAAGTHPLTGPSPAHGHRRAYVTLLTK